MIRNLAVTADNFLMGGRETFLQTNIRAIRDLEKGKTVLLADRISASEALDGFFAHHEIGVPSNNSLKRWLDEGRQFLIKHQSEMIWAQHYSTLNSFLLAALLDVPLHVTLHGSLLNHGRYDRMEDALGLTLALHRGAYVTAVSREIVDELKVIAPRAKNIGVYHNKVMLPLADTLAKMEERSDSVTTQLVCLSRSEKTGHIRSSILVLSALLKVGVDARLSIYSTGDIFSSTATRARISMFRAVSQVVGRRWIFQNLGVLRAIMCTTLRPAVQDSLREMEKADVVLGMGRVVLEAISINKTVVLIGYDEPIDIITPDNFLKFQYANFSGRNDAARPVGEIAAELAKQLGNRRPSWAGAIATIDIIQSWCDTKAHHERAACFGAVRLNNAERSRVDEYLKGSVTNVDLLASLISGLSDDERSTFEKLKADLI